MNGIELVAADDESDSQQTGSPHSDSSRHSFKEGDNITLLNSHDDKEEDLDQDADDGGGGELKPTLSNAGAVAVIVGTIVGSGIFASPGVVLKHSGSPGAALVVWTLCGFFAYLGASCYAELGAALPESGGEVHYLGYIYGSLFSFLFSWTNAVVTRPASLAIIATVFGEYTCLLFWSSNDAPRSELSLFFVRLAAILIIIIITAINSLSVTTGMYLQCVTTILKVISLVLIVFSGLYYALFMSTPILTIPIPMGEGEGSNSNSFDNSTNNVVTNSTTMLMFGSGYLGFANTTESVGDFGLAFQAGLWSYDGWNNLNYAVGEMRSPASLPTVIRTATLLVVLLYISVNIAYLRVLPLDIVKTSEAVGTDYGRLMLGGDFGAILISLSVITSTLGALNGSIFSGSRLVHTAADKELLPSCLACVDKKRSSPIRALLCQAMIAAVLCMVGTFDTLVNYFGAAAWLFYLITVFGVVVLRWTEPDLKRPFQVYLTTPVVFSLFGIMLVFTPIIVSPWETVAALSFVLVGIPVWFWRVRMERRSFWCCDMMKSGRLATAAARRGDVATDPIDRGSIHPGVSLRRSPTRTNKHAMGSKPSVEYRRV